MIKRKMNRTGLCCSTLGFGAMRLPLKEDGNYSNVDEEKAIELMRYALNNGINYIDTAYVYHDGNSERILGKALKDGYREKAVIATKLPIGRVAKNQDMYDILDEQLERLQTHSIDYYLLHALNKGSWKKAKDFGVLEFLNESRRRGKIKYPGFSFHDDVDCFKDILDSYDWDMCQIQFNYMDTKHQAGLEGLKYAADKGMDIVVMEPLRGGDLVNNIPDELNEYFKKADIKKRPIEWAFRWLYDFPQIKVILSGMSSMEQLKDNLKIFEESNPCSMTKEEKELMEGAIYIMNRMTKVGCTSCKYCIPCPQGINIPLLFNIYNSYYRFKNKESLKDTYREWRNREQNKFTADLCIGCRICEEKCPQRLEISQLLKILDSEMR